MNTLFPHFRTRPRGFGAVSRSDSLEPMPQRGSAAAEPGPGPASRWRRSPRPLRTKCPPCPGPRRLLLNDPLRSPHCHQRQQLPSTASPAPRAPPPLSSCHQLRPRAFPAPNTHLHFPPFPSPLPPVISAPTRRLNPHGTLIWLLSLLVLA